MRDDGADSACLATGCAHPPGELTAADRIAEQQSVVVREAARPSSLDD